MNMRWVLWLFVIVSGHALAGDAPWRTATTANYRIISQISDRDTRDWMRDFDQFILSTSDTLRINLRALPPLTVVIFARDKDYGPYKLLRPNGTTANLAGQFVWRPTWSTIAMAHDAFDDQSRRVIYHEATHWLMSFDQSSQPAWFSEGIAEMFSTFERVGTKVNWAKPISEHLALLHSGPQMPLAAFLAEPSALFDRDDRTDLFYAQAWAFTHFLMLSQNGGRRPLLLKFLETFKTKSGDATVNAVFGSSLADIGREFDIYLDQRSWPYMTEPAKPAADPPALQPASAELVEASLGFLALGASRPDLARQHAEKAIELDASAPDGHTILAYLASDAHHDDEAASHAEAALQRGSKDSAMFTLLGDSYADGANSRKPDAARLRVTLYENAINLNPRQMDSYDRLAGAVIGLEKPREDDIKFLNVGMRLFPGDDWLHVGVAAMDYQLGRRETALPALENALLPDSKLDPRQRSFATGLHDRWLMTAMQLEVTGAMNNRDFTGARAVLSRYRERVSKSAQTDSFLKDIDDELDVRELLAQYQALRSDKKNAEAQAVAAKLLAKPDLPADMRRYLQGKP